MYGELRRVAAGIENRAHFFALAARVAKSPSVKVVKYVPEIRDIQVAGNVAYEWGYFEAAQKSSDQQGPESLRAKLLRVMKRQPDGSWKFTRVMWFPD